MKYPLRKTLWEFYGPTFPLVLIQALKVYYYRVGDFLAWFWSTRQFEYHKQPVSLMQKTLGIYYGVLVMGIFALAYWAFNAGRWQLGAALLITYPLISTHVLALTLLVRKVVWFALHPKKMLRSFMCVLLERQVVSLRRKHTFTVIAVAGSVGKTSSKLAIANLLERAGERVLMQEGNYNDRVTVPLVFFSQKLESLFSPRAWVHIIRAMRKVIRAQTYPYDVVVVELGTDGPGQLIEFTYIRPEISLVTAVSPEHMEFFGSIAEVAREELQVVQYSGKTLINVDDTAAEYRKDLDYISYGVTSKAEYCIVSSTKETIHGQRLDMQLRDTTVALQTTYLGRQGATITLAAAAVADLLGMSHKLIVQHMPELKPFSGRMQLLQGIMGATLIDDTYNNSPLAAKAALDVLYKTKAPQKIVIMGDMNELGAMSPSAHTDVGSYCERAHIDKLVTIGPLSKQYLAPAAAQQGCDIISFDSPYDAGEYVKSILKKGAVVLAKGSQNRVFAEESLKILLHNASDVEKLVRQSKSWLAKKQQQFHT